MRIAIVDDNSQDANRIVFLLSDVSNDLAFTRYTTGRAFLDALEGGETFDLAFLDIFLEQENGMEIASALRKASPDTDIIFCTTSRDYAVDAFRIQAADYLVKPYSELDVVKAFARVSVKRKSSRPAGILFQIGRELRVIHPEDVIKIESERHYTTVTDIDGTQDRIHLGYAQVADRFPDTFIEIRRGLSVNLAFIIGIKGNTVTLTDGTVYAISRPRQDEVISRYTKFITDA